MKERDELSGKTSADRDLGHWGREERELGIPTVLCLNT